MMSNQCTDLIWKLYKLLLSLIFRLENFLEFLLALSYGREYEFESDLRQKTGSSFSDLIKTVY